MSETESLAMMHDKVPAHFCSLGSILVSEISWAESGKILREAQGQVGKWLIIGVNNVLVNRLLDAHLK